MKIQHIAVIFVIIILPIAMVMSSYIGSQIDTITLQTKYDTKLTNATYDAITAWQINTVNNRYSTVSDSKIRDIEASIKTFYNSMSNNEYLTQEEMQAYTPALVYTLYDGYYIYSKYDNMYPENGGTIYTNENDANANYGLKPYIYYACRYKDSSREFVVNYTLDNAITIYGTFTVDGQKVYKTLSGYLINPNSVNISNNLVDTAGNIMGTPRNWKLTYDIHEKHDDDDTITIGPEILTEHLLFADGSKGDYNYLTYNGQKIYYEKTSTASSKMYFTYQNYAKQYVTNSVSNSKMFQYLTNRTYDGALHSTSAFEYYYNAKMFSEQVANLTKGISQNNAIDENGAKINFDVNTGRDEIFVASSNNNPLMAYSVFDENRRSVIKKSIESNLITAIAQYNLYSSNSYDFSLPSLLETDWEKITNNVSVISLLQGIPIGHKYYNNYCVLTNNNNEENVKKENVYVITQNPTTEAREYHFVGCKHLLEELTDPIVVAYSNLNLIRQTVRISENNYMYFYPQNIADKKITACYYCIVNASDAFTTEQVLQGQIKEYDEASESEKVKYDASKPGTENERFKKIREEYIKALARESYDLYQVEMDSINGVKEADINNDVKEKTEVTVEPISIEMHKRESRYLRATVKPAGTKLAWYSDDTNVVTVDEQGKVTAVREGKAKVTVTAQDGSYASADCYITVVDEKVSKITIEPEELLMYVGEKYTPTYSVEPDNATNKTVRWTSSKPEIAEVEEDTGRITAVNAGEAYITATAEDGSGVTARCKVTVTIKPVLATAITLDKTNVILAVDATRKITAKVYPENITKKEVIYTSEDESIATITADGVITGKKVGTTSIIVSATDGSNVTARCTVTVVPKKIQEIILTPKEVSLYSGETTHISATVLPDEAQDKNIRWDSINEDVAKVDQNGTVTAVSVGETEIIATAQDGSGIQSTQKCKIKVLKRNITISTNLIEMYRKDKKKITAQITPDKPTTKLIWSSSDESIAQVSQDGTVTAIDKGKVTITVRAADGSVCNQQCQVIVKEDYYVECPYQNDQMRFDIKERISSNYRSFNSVTNGNTGFKIRKQGNIDVKLEIDEERADCITLKYIIKNPNSYSVDYGVSTYCDSIENIRNRYRVRRTYKTSTSYDQDLQKMTVNYSDIKLELTFLSDLNGIWMGDNDTQEDQLGQNWWTNSINTKYSNYYRERDPKYRRYSNDRYYVNRYFNYYVDSTLTYNWKGKLQPGEEIEKLVFVKVKSK